METKQIILFILCNISVFLFLGLWMKWQLKSYQGQISTLITLNLHEVKELRCIMKDLEEKIGK